MYIRAVLTGNLVLHLSALVEFVNYFFELDKLNNARMIPDLTEITQLERTNPVIWSEFSNGNWVLNNNTTPFCAIHPLLCHRTSSCFGTNQQMDESYWWPCWHNTE